MASSYSKWMRCIEVWKWGSVTLGAFEVNPRSGPPDHVIDVTKEGECGIMPCPPMEDWEPSEHMETSFVLFLTNPRGDILLDGVYFRDESYLRQHVEQCRLIFEPLAPEKANP